VDSYPCPECGSPKVLLGRVFATNGHPVVFVPHGIDVTGWTVPGVGFPYDHLCCLSCGLLWTRVAPEQVRLTITQRGSPIARQLFAVMDSGPYHGLPDVPEARRAADCVVEIDRLMLDGRQPAATRRYRDLMHCTWDQAIDALRRWAELERDEKLSRFGWHPKDVSSGRHREPLAHPMRDRLLDG